MRANAPLLKKVPLKKQFVDDAIFTLCDNVPINFSKHIKNVSIVRPVVSTVIIRTSFLRRNTFCTGERLHQNYQNLHALKITVYNISIIL